MGSSSPYKILIYPALFLIILWLTFFLILNIQPETPVQPVNSVKCELETYTKHYENYTLSFKVTIPKEILSLFESQYAWVSLYDSRLIRSGYTVDYSQDLTTTMNKTFSYYESSDAQGLKVLVKPMFVNQIDNSSSFSALEFIPGSFKEYDVRCPFKQHLEIEQHRVFILVGASITLFVLCICVILWILTWMESVKHPVIHF